MQKFVVGALVGVLLLNVFVMLMGLYFGSQSTVTYAIETGKVVFGTVVGALASALPAGTARE